MSHAIARPLYIMYPISVMYPFAGGYYSDDVGHVAPSCKRGPNGSFVHIDKAPGTQSQDCKSCPRGNMDCFE